MYKIFKINLEKCKEFPTHFGWDYLITGERYIFRNINIKSLRYGESKYPGFVPEYYYDSIGINHDKAIYWMRIEEDQLQEEEIQGSYSLVWATDSITAALSYCGYFSPSKTKE